MLRSNCQPCSFFASLSLFLTRKLISAANGTNISIVTNKIWTLGLPVPSLLQELQLLWGSPKTSQDARADPPSISEKRQKGAHQHRSWTTALGPTSVGNLGSCQRHSLVAVTSFSRLKRTAPTAKSSCGHGFPSLHEPRSVQTSHRRDVYSVLKSAESVCIGGR